MRERGKIVLLVLGGLVTLLGVAFLTAGLALRAAVVQRDAEGYVVFGEAQYRSGAYALVSERLDLGEGAGADRMARPGGATSVRIRVRNERPGAAFVGIAASGDAAAYLERVPHDVVRTAEHGRVAYRSVDGTHPPVPPGRTSIWVASVSGTGTQSLVWPVRRGSWTIVVMNADASPAIAVALQPALKAAWIVPLVASLASAGAFALLVGIALVLYGGTRALDAVPPSVPASAFPVVLEGRLDAPLSRWLWLVKWFLAIPHVIVLACLGVAFGVLTVAAFVAILAGGRYPATLFATNVGIMRWSWRVGFYAYSALGTDRYPPFSLRDADYPARLEVAYPEQLSRGLALVKWWLLAIPHYLIVGLFTGGAWYAQPSTGDDPRGPHPPNGVLPLLVLFAAVALLFTGRYPRGLFALIVGLNRWVVRVTTYAALMHDAYPPFRLDLGGEEQPYGAIDSASAGRSS